MIASTGCTTHSDLPGGGGEAVGVRKAVSTGTHSRRYSFVFHSQSPALFRNGSNVARTANRFVRGTGYVSRVRPALWGGKWSNPLTYPTPERGVSELPCHKSIVSLLLP
jgi:hypothetical protein